MKTLKLTMQSELDVFKCSVCEKLVEIIDPQGVELSCCGRSMVPQAIQKAKIGMYPHSIIIANTHNGMHVSVGRPLHCMDNEHRLLWIELIAHDKIHRQLLRPGDFPAATFDVIAESATVRAYCNNHGLWSCEASDFRLTPSVSSQTRSPRRWFGSNADMNGSLAKQCLFNCRQ